MSETEGTRTSAFAYYERFLEADKFLKVQPAPLRALLEDSLVVLDTNSLLIPFSTSPKSWEAIRKVLEAYSRDGRLRVPKHVVREFVVQRAEHLKNLYNSLQDVARVAQEIQIPFLQASKSYKDAQKLYEPVKVAADAYRQSVNKVRDEVRNLRWDDPVSAFLATLDASVFVEPEVGEEGIGGLEQDLQRRLDLGMGPGQKDASKESNSAGDYLIWRSILHMGHSDKKNVLFVSSETKNDWWHVSGGTPLYPRFEMVAEFWEVSGGKTFHIATLDAVLQALEVDKSIVEEVGTAVEQSDVAPDGHSTTSAHRELGRLARAARQRQPTLLPMPRDLAAKQAIALKSLGFAKRTEAIRAMSEDGSFPAWLEAYHRRARVARRPYYRDEELSRYTEYVALRQGGMTGLSEMYILTGADEAKAVQLARRVYEEVHIPTMEEFEADDEEVGQD